METKRFLFVMWEGGGNVSPQLGLARRMVERGHDVRVLTEASVQADVAATGASFVPFTKAPNRSDRSRESDLVRDSEALTPLGAFAALRNNLVFGPARRYAEDTLAEIRRFHPHVLAPDWMLTGAAIAGEVAGIPCALLMHNLNLVPESGRPAPGFGFLPSTSVLGRIRDRVFVSAYLRLFNRGIPALNQARHELGLQPIQDVLEHMARADRLLVQYSEAFDFPSATRMPNLSYVGSVLAQPSWADAWAPTWPDDDGIPLVLVSLSTTYMSQEKTLRRCIEAVAGMSLHTVVTVGPALDPTRFSGPDSVQVVASAPHDAILQRASAVITHAGLSTVTRALSYGVPLVCVPLGRDQDDVAARVTWHGAGLRVGRNAPAAQMRAALRRVLGEASFRQAAARLGAAIQADAEADRGVMELEALAGATVDPMKGAVAS